MEMNTNLQTICECIRATIAENLSEVKAIGEKPEYYSWHFYDGEVWITFGEYEDEDYVFARIKNLSEIKKDKLKSVAKLLLCGKTKEAATILGDKRK